MRLRAPSVESLSAVRVVVQDAIRTAALPSGPRLYVYRRLPLGRIRRGCSPASLALTIEEQLRRLTAAAVYALRPTAAQCDAVFFADDAEPSQLLALRLASQQPVDAWFWPLAVPGFCRDCSLSTGMRQALWAADRSSASVAAVVQLVRSLAEGDQLDALLDALTPSDAQLLSPRLTAPLRSLSATLPPQPSWASDPVNAHLQAALRQRATRWAADDPRLRWLVAVTLLLETRTLIDDSTLSLRVDQRLDTVQSLPDARQPPTPRQRTLAAASIAAQVVPPGTDQRLPRPALQNDHQVPATDMRPEPQTSVPASDRFAVSPTAEVSPSPPSTAKSSVPSIVAHGRSGLALHAEHSAAVPTQAKQTAQADAPMHPEVTRLLLPAAADFAALRTKTTGPLAAVTDVQTAYRSPPHQRHAATTDPDRADSPLLAQPTQAGGLLFLIPILDRLGLPQLLARDPRWIDFGLPHRILLHCAAALRVPAQDPIHAALALPIVEEADPIDPLTAAMLSVWFSALRRYVARGPRLTLRALVCRPALLHATPTHIDLDFAMHQADMRIRRHGLDIDPGWVPWLFRVVHYRYHPRLPSVQDDA